MERFHCYCAALSQTHRSYNNRSITAVKFSGVCCPPVIVISEKTSGPQTGFCLQFCCFAPVHLSCIYNKSKRTSSVFNFQSSHLVLRDLPHSPPVIGSGRRFALMGHLHTTLFPRPLIDLQYNLHLYSPLHRYMI